MLTEYCLLWNSELFLLSNLPKCFDILQYFNPPPPCHPFYYIGLCTSVTFWQPPFPLQCHDVICECPQEKITSVKNVVRKKQQSMAFMNNQSTDFVKRQVMYISSAMRSEQECHTKSEEFDDILLKLGKYCNITTYTNYYQFV